MSDYLRQQTLALLGQEFLIQALSNGGSLNSAVAEILLRPTTTATTGKEKSAAALTGRIRSDSAVLLQGSKNASEAASMATMVKDATNSMAATMNEMLTIAQAVKNNEMTAAAAAPMFKTLASQLTGTIEGTQYNGISLLDKTGWTGDERLTVSGDGSTASLSIQVGNAASTFTLRDLSDLKGYETTDLTNTGNLTTLIDNLTTDIGTLNTMSSGYQSVAGSYTSEAKFMEQQAETLAVAADRAQFGASQSGGDSGASEETLKSLLMDMLLRDQGRLVDTSS